MHLAIVFNNLSLGSVIQDSLVSELIIETRSLKVKGFIPNIDVFLCAITPIANSDKPASSPVNNSVNEA
jgi:hypothetical protein